ncbi:MAG: hypothetical protein Q8M29_19800 [Bacteroidota bacterium]|nr:hypothetical protein [Bacteroidota bacterium]
MTKTLQVLLIIIIFNTACRSTKVVEQAQYTVQEKLSHPFGTVLKMKVEVVDGDTRGSKGYNSSFYFKIKSVEGKSIGGNVIMDFQNSFNINLPRNEEELYEYIYNKKQESSNRTELDSLKKEYVGSTFEIIAYETGRFSGIPNGPKEYDKCWEAWQDQGFHFENYLLILCDLNKKKEK